MCAWCMPFKWVRVCVCVGLTRGGGGFDVLCVCGASVCVCVSPVPINFHINVAGSQCDTINGSCLAGVNLWNFAYNVSGPAACGWPPPLLLFMCVCVCLVVVS